MKFAPKRSLLFATLVPFSLLGQAPEFEAANVVNGASYLEPGRVRPSMMATIFGQHLATGTATATGYPLPNVLAGTSVQIGGLPAPLLYVSPNQINLVVPSFTDFLSPTIPLVVQTATGGKREVAVVPWTRWIGLFSRDGSACGPAAALSYWTDGTASINDESSSALPGGYVSVFGTVLGRVWDPAPDVFPAGAESRSYGGPVLRVGLPSFRVYETSRSGFNGRAPGLAGVDQLNVRLHPETPEACAVPVLPWLMGGNQPVTISVAREGASCRDSAPGIVAAFRWHRVTVSGPRAAESSVTDRLVGWVLEAQRSLLFLPPDLSPWTGFRDEPQDNGLTGRCGIPGVRLGSAGALRAVDADGAARTAEHRAGSAYEAVLPSGTLRQGTFRVSAAGGEVGPFESQVDIPPPIRILGQFPPGLALSHSSWTLRWEGGQPGAVIRVKLVSTSPESPISYGTAKAEGGQFPIFTPTSFNSTDFAELHVYYEPAPENVTTFSAANLSLGGSLSWRYEFQFKGLSIR